MKILAIIPARYGSKGIVKKNIRTLGGKPLIQYSIEDAQNSKIFDRIIVSTDNKKIAKIANSLNAEVPFLRPKKISGDFASVFDVIKHALNFLEKNESYIPEIITILQPTSPFRDTQIIRKSITILKNSTATSAITVTELKKHPYKSFSYKRKKLVPFIKNFESFESRQKLPKLLYPTGSVYSFWKKNIEKYDSFYGPRITPIKTSGIFSMDIDDEYDLQIAELIISNKIKK